MLESLRAVQNTWIGRSVLAVVMAVIVISFAIWGIGDIFRGFNANQVAQVGSVTITAAAYRQAYQTELQSLQQRFRRAITNEEAHRFGVDAQVLTRLISEAVLDDQARTLGLAISDTEIAKSIRDDPTFAGPAGDFDRARFDAVLRNTGNSEQSFVREQRQTYLRQALVQALVGGLVAPMAAVDALHRYQAETRSLDFVTLEPAVAGDVPTPDQAALEAYFDAHAHDFAAPQYRKLVVLALTPTSLSKPEDVSDEDARKLYDEVKAARFTTPERRTVQQIVFPSEAEADSAAARIKAGAPFVDIVAERKLDPKSVDLGTVTREQLVDKTVADAAFALPADGTSDIVKGAFGPVLVHVAAIEPATTKPYDEVAAALKTEVATKRAGSSLTALHDRIEDARSSGKPLSEAAQIAGLQAQTIDAVDASGLDKAGTLVEGLPDRDALLKAAFASDVGVDNDTIQTRDGGSIWYEVAAVEPARARTLDEIRPAVEKAWQAEDTTKRLAAKTDDLVKALDGGKTIEQVAASLGNLPVMHSGDARRSGATGLAPDAVAAVFDVPVGQAGSAPSGGGRTLFKVLDSVVPPLDPASPEATQLGNTYRGQISEDILSAYLAKVGARIGAKVNQNAVRAAVGPS